MNKKFFTKAILKKSNTIKQAIRNLASSGLQICLICEQNKLLGTVTDGDIRRALLKKMNFETAVEKIMNTNYISVQNKTSLEKIKTLLTSYKINQIPVIDKKKNLIDVFFSETIEAHIQYDNPVIIMAGGFGKRLMPITKNCPKPLLPVLGRPVMEHLIIKLKNEGFKNIYISTHYLADMIKEYFQDGCNFGVNIKYINEDIPLGTAGSLSKFKSDNKKDFLVCNGDVLTDISFAQLMSHHFEQKATATMAVRRYHWQHPFGVIKTEKNKLQIKSIHEKPIQETFVNAGIYVFKDKVKDWIKKDKKLEMPSLFKLLRRKKEKTIIFPMYESWLDIGNSKEYEEAQKKTKK